MTFSDLRLLLLALTLLVACLVIVLQFVRLRRLQKSLEELRTTRSEDETGEKQKAPEEFRSSLLEATLKSRLENGSNWRRAPEKYRYAAALAEQGAEAERIAELLQLPLPEVHQLIALRKAKGGTSNQ